VDNVSVLTTEFLIFCVKFLAPKGMGDSFGSKHSAFPSYLLKSKDSDFT